MHVLLAISDPRAAAQVARLLRKRGMTVDVAMNTRLASAMGADRSYDIVVFEHSIAPEMGLLRHNAGVWRPAILELTTSEAVDPEALASQVRTVADGR